MRFFAVQSRNSKGEENNCKRNHVDFLYVYGIVYGVKTNMKRTATIKRNSRIQTGNEAGQIVLEKAFDEDAARARREIMQKYRSDDSVHQIMIVSHTDGWNGNMSFYEKAGENDAWTLVLEGEVYIGKNGMNKIKEGDAKTPYGDFEILQAFGILPNPGTSIDYIDVTPDTFACDEDCEFYNQIINVKETDDYLVSLKSHGAMIIDTPGMRELGMWDADEGIDSLQPLHQYGVGDVGGESYAVQVRDVHVCADGNRSAPVPFGQQAVHHVERVRVRPSGRGKCLTEQDKKEYG